MTVFPTKLSPASDSSSPLLDLLKAGVKCVSQLRDALAISSENWKNVPQIDANCKETVEQLGSLAVGDGNHNFQALKFLMLRPSY